MPDRIDQMRIDFSRLLAFRLDSGEWDRNSAAEHGRAISQAVASGDSALIELWANWVAKQAANEYGPAPALPDDLVSKDSNRRSA